MWEESMVGMDDLNDTMHIAWSPSTVNLSDLPTPGASSTGSTSETTACNGHGWVMGSGASAHCMCDEGYIRPDGNWLGCVSESAEDGAHGREQRRHLHGGRVWEHLVARLLRSDCAGLLYAVTCLGLCLASGVL